MLVVLDVPENPAREIVTELLNIVKYAVVVTVVENPKAVNVTLPCARYSQNHEAVPVPPDAFIQVKVRTELLVDEGTPTIA